MTAELRLKPGRPGPRPTAAASRPRPRPSPTIACSTSSAGINTARSRGDREEVFGGLGASWKGAFVGGDLLVQAVTVRADGREDRLDGNFPSYSHFPDT